MFRFRILGSILGRRMTSTLPVEDLGLLICSRCGGRHPTWWHDSERACSATVELHHPREVEGSCLKE